MNRNKLFAIVRQLEERRWRVMEEDFLEFFTAHGWKYVDAQRWARRIVETFRYATDEELARELEMLQKGAESRERLAAARSRARPGRDNIRTGREKQLVIGLPSI